MKQFVYQVGEFEFVDTEAFGQAWRDAKAKATERHMPIYREVREVRREVFLTGGVFGNADMAQPKDIQVF